MKIASVSCALPARLTLTGSVAAVALVLLTSHPAQAATTSFDTDPFTGSTALATPGRQVFAG